MTFIYEEISCKCALETEYKGVIFTTDCRHPFIERHSTVETNIDNCRGPPIDLIAVNNVALLGGNDTKGEVANQATRLPKLYGGDTCE